MPAGSSPDGSLLRRARVAVTAEATVLVGVAVGTGILTTVSPT